MASLSLPGPATRPDRNAPTQAAELRPDAKLVLNCARQQDVEVEAEQVVRHEDVGVFRLNALEQATE